MSFLVAAALAVGLLVALPIAAHLLRRGRAREQEFPPAALVPVAPPVARQRSRLEDRALLGIRGLMIAALALLGATPLVRCSRLSLSRQSGASVALAIVIDDSASMRAKTLAGPTRWERAKAAAAELLASAREGDAVAIVLAGAPARLALATTTDLSAARSAAADLGPSDRSTDLTGAVQIARSALAQLPHVDKRVVMLSDLAADPVPKGDPPAWAPLPELRAAVDNCGVASAERSGRKVTATIGCTTANAARGRDLVVVAGESIAEPGGDAGASRANAGDVLGRARLAVRAGTQTLTVDLDAELVGLDVTLEGKDASEHDDRAPVAPRSAGLAVTAVTDPAASTVITGGATVIEQALEALGADALVRPRSVLPDDPKELSTLAAIVLDDPGGITPEARLALTDWVERGGVALALLGPRVDAAKLGATLEPFVRGEVSWTSTRDPGVDPKSVAWLGDPGKTLAELGAKGRVELDAVAPSGSRIAARWSDGSAFLLETRIGRGLLLTTSLPASVDVSDLALRPGFLALLDHTLSEAARRSGPPRSRAGVPWLFPSGSAVEIQGPEGALSVQEQRLGDAVSQKVAVPEIRGRYRVKTDAGESLRVVTLDADELGRRARDPAAAGVEASSDGGESQVDASREVALALLVLLAAELALRAAGRRRSRRRAGEPTAEADDLRRAA